MQRGHVQVGLKKKEERSWLALVLQEAREM